MERAKDRRQRPVQLFKNLEQFSNKPQDRIFRNSKKRKEIKEKKKNAVTIWKQRIDYE